MYSSRAFEVAREGQREDRDRATHQYCRRADQQRRETDIERESEARIAVRNEQ